MELYAGRSNKKWCSSSTCCAELHSRQSLSFLSRWTLFSHRPVSTVDVTVAILLLATRSGIKLLSSTGRRDTKYACQQSSWIRIAERHIKCCELLPGHRLRKHTRRFRRCVRPCPLQTSCDWSAAYVGIQLGTALQEANCSRGHISEVMIARVHQEVARFSDRWSCIAIDQRRDKLTLRSGWWSAAFSQYIALSYCCYDKNIVLLKPQTLRGAVRKACIRALA